MKFSGAEGRGYGVSQISQFSMNLTASLLLTLSEPHPYIIGTVGLVRRPEGVGSDSLYAFL